MSAEFVSLNRRGFVCGAAVLALPIALPSAGVTPLPSGPLLTDWSVDDMWTGYPRPAQAIGYGHAKQPCEAAVQPGSIDVLFA